MAGWPFSVRSAELTRTHPPASPGGPTVKGPSPVSAGMSDVRRQMLCQPSYSRSLVASLTVRAPDLAAGVVSDSRRTERSLGTIYGVSHNLPLGNVPPPNRYAEGAWVFATVPRQSRAPPFGGRGVPCQHLGSYPVLCGRPMEERRERLPELFG